MTLVDILQPLLGALMTAVATIFSFRAGRRKSNAEARGEEAKAKAIELDNTEKAIEIYRKMVEEMAQRHREDYEKIYNQNQQLLKQQDELLKKIDHLEGELIRLKKG